MLSEFADDEAQMAELLNKTKYSFKLVDGFFLRCGVTIWKCGFDYIHSCCLKSLHVDRIMQ